MDEDPDIGSAACNFMCGTCINSRDCTGCPGAYANIKDWAIDPSCGCLDGCTDVGSTGLCTCPVTCE